MNDSILIEHIRSTLLYYDIFAYPLKTEEAFTFLPVNSITVDDVRKAAMEAAREQALFFQDGYASVDRNIAALIDRRHRMEEYARRHWRVARLMTHVIKRCPFVRCVFITGTLSKNLSAPHLDIDYFIITAPGRLWIARTLLTAFKKLFLLGSRKYFCLNYFISEDALEIPDQNIFTATEIAHAKVLFNTRLFRRFRETNSWVKNFFPNLSDRYLPSIRANDRTSIILSLLEFPFKGTFGDRIDDWLMRRWRVIWRERYRDLPDEKRDALFRVTKTTSKAHGPDFQTRILDAYDLRLAGTRFRLEEVRV